MVSNKLKIVAYLHCGLCLEEWKSDPEIRKKFSPKEYANVQAGWTKEGIQLWCNRHECNILHIDFEVQTHTANTTREEKKESISSIPTLWVSGQRK